MAHSTDPSVQILVGTYSRRGGKGAHLLSLHKDGNSRLSDPIKCMQDISFAVSANGLHYCVEERDEGQIGIYSLTTAERRCLGRFPTAGAQPCHLAIDGASSCLA